MKVMGRTCHKSVQVVADATAVVSHAGSALLVELADRLGLITLTCGRVPVHLPT